MKTIGITCSALVKQYGIDRTFRLCKESGFNAVDFGLDSLYRLGDDVYGGSDDAFESHFDMIKRKAAEYELIISQTHGRCCPYHPNDEAYNRNTDKLNALDLRATAHLGAPACVIHFLESSAWGKKSPEVMHEQTARMFDAALPYAEQYKVSIAMETFGAARIKGARIRDFFADPTEFKRQFDRLNTTYKTICVDTGHTHEAESFWVPAPEDMIRMLGKDISVLHLHDNNGHWDDHLLPGMGNIHWDSVFDALDDVGYSGVYNFELGIKYGILNEDFVRFAGQYLRKFVDCRGRIK